MCILGPCTQEIYFHIHKKCNLSRHFFKNWAGQGIRTADFSLFSNLGLKINVFLTINKEETARVKKNLENIRKELHSRIPLLRLNIELFRDLFLSISENDCDQRPISIDTEPQMSAFVKNLGDFFSHYIQHCFICRHSDSTVPTDAGIESRTVATGALAVRRSNH